jgi:2-oxoglutarate dehydrogenase E1 component
MARNPSNEAFLRTSFLSSANAGYVEDMQAEYERNPGSVSDEWRHFFESLNEERSLVRADERGPSWGHPPEMEDGDLVAALTGDYEATERNRARACRPRRRRWATRCRRPPRCAPRRI